MRRNSLERLKNKKQHKQAINSQSQAKDSPPPSFQQTRNTMCIKSNNIFKENSKNKKNISPNTKRKNEKNEKKVKQNQAVAVDLFPHPYPPHTHTPCWEDAVWDVPSSPIEAPREGSESWDADSWLISSSCPCCTKAREARIECMVRNDWMENEMKWCDGKHITKKTSKWRIRGNIYRTEWKT